MASGPDTLAVDDSMTSLETVLADQRRILAINLLLAIQAANLAADADDLDAVLESAGRQVEAFQTQLRALLSDLGK